MTQDIRDNSCTEQRIYANIILPVKFGGDITYIVPNIYNSNIQEGTRVKVDLSGKIYDGVIHNVLNHEQLKAQLLQQTKEKNGTNKEINYKPILSVEELPPVSKAEIRLWEQLASYYLCSIGEIFKAAYTSMTLRQETVKPRKTVAHFIESIHQHPDINCPQLSPAQEKTHQAILEQTQQHPHKPILLKGVTGSGKTEIYINLAQRQLEQGRNVLYMVPEIAISKQLQNRLKKVFAERLLTFHSKQTASEKARIHKILTSPSPVPPVIILGTRSALFLPYRELGLIIIDEEHDTSYKQTDPAPRYHARDTAIILANIHKSNILLGSATPSFESEYNCEIGRYTKIELNEKYYGAVNPYIEIVDLIYARKSRQMVGSFSQKLINEIRKTITNNGQVLIFRNRRSYSPIVECTECGSIPKCPHCNVYLSYHKYNNTLRCHYCDYTAPFNGICPKCGLDTLKYKGAGTEKLEEELKAIFPDKNIARYDADITKSKTADEQVIKEFANGTTNILIGTQMISKGFDFERLNLVAVMQADTILGIQDFRADERAIQLFNQLMGRTGRRGIRGKLIIQTNQKEHPVFKQLSENQHLSTNLSNTLIANILSERKEFNFAPYVRMVKVIVKHKDPQKLDELCAKISHLFKPETSPQWSPNSTLGSNIPAGPTSSCYPSVPCHELTGPFIPPIDRIRGEYLKCFYVKFSRDSNLSANKQALLQAITTLHASHSVILDVDPC
ncbi:MAG: primosomal protein N' [Bacteroidales bacterium]